MSSHSSGGMRGRPRSHCSPGPDGGTAEPDDVPPLAPEDHACASCQMRYADTSLEAAITAIRSYPERYRQALKDRTGAILRQRPGPHTWSALEYTCHVRDVYSVYTDRLARTLAQERPILEPMRNEQRAARGDYNNQDPRDVLDALTEQVAQFASRAESVTPAQLSRTATRLPGEERTVLWLVRQASHEGLHHLRDIERILVSLAGAES